MIYHPHPMKGLWSSIATRYAALVASLDQDEQEPEKSALYVIADRSDFYTLLGGQEGSLPFPGLVIKQGSLALRAQADPSLKGVALFSKEEADSVLLELEVKTGKKGSLVVLTAKEWKLWLLPRLRELNLQTWKMTNK